MFEEKKNPNMKLNFPKARFGKNSSSSSHHEVEPMVEANMRRYSCYCGLPAVEWTSWTQ